MYYVQSLLALSDVIRASRLFMLINHNLNSESQQINPSIRREKPSGTHCCVPYNRRLFLICGGFY